MITNHCKLDTVRVFLKNLHCSSCVQVINEVFERHSGEISRYSVFQVQRLVEFVYEQSFDVDIICSELIKNGFEIDEVLSKDGSSILINVKENQKESIKTHKSYCKQCQIFQDSTTRVVNAQKYSYRFAINGMHCSSCCRKIQNKLSNLKGIGLVQVDLLSQTASIYASIDDLESKISSEIKLMGYDVQYISRSQEESVILETRHVILDIQGFYCNDCPTRFQEAVTKFKNCTVSLMPTFEYPRAEVKYIPDVPNFTLRDIKASIEDLGFKINVYKPKSVQDRVQEIQKREEKSLRQHIILMTLFAVPAGLLMMYMNFNIFEGFRIREIIMQPLIGSLTLINFLLFIIATPVEFGIAFNIHKRALISMYSLWSSDRKVTLKYRLTRFGSMDLLTSMGTSIAYFSSVFLAVRAALDPQAYENNLIQTNYFDTTIFLVLFVLIGRYMEIISKKKAADSMLLLGQMQETFALIAKTGETVFLDYLEIGDVLRVSKGSKLVADGVVIWGLTEFDSSAITGESFPQKKAVGDKVYAGSLNLQKSVDVKITSLPEQSMISQISSLIQKGQARKASVENLALRLLEYFVPIITYLAILTGIVWYTLGCLGKIKLTTEVDQIGGWGFWSLQFAISVFVIACPCGIGLAAPTASYVGSALAAKKGILVTGGTEAFQSASSIDAIVFDKTNTLTDGNHIEVRDQIYDETTISQLPQDKLNWDINTIKGLIYKIESHSSHPFAKAISDHCKSNNIDVDIIDIHEHPGKGISATFVYDSKKYDAIIGSERFTNELRVKPLCREMLQTSYEWKSQGDSIIMAAIGSSGKQAMKVLAMFSYANKIKPEAFAVISKLKLQNIKVWLITGDNRHAANFVARKLNIEENCVVSNSLPSEKAAMIQRLQLTIEPNKSIHGCKYVRSLTRYLYRDISQSNLATIAMVGDGINDAPALAAANVSIVMASGTDVAMGTASFILMDSNLKSIDEVLRLSKLIYSRINLNLFWAILYNVLAIPVAAGLFYDFNITLDPVWASIAMALSSVSVVTSSYLLIFQKSCNQ